jgi:hypothetical protein
MTVFNPTNPSGDAMRTLLRSLLSILALILVVPSANAADPAISAFYGHFEGKTLDSVGTELSPRDMAVDVEPHKKGGFKLTWTTVIKRDNGKVKRKTHTVSFAPSGVDNVYASAMRTNLFGKAVPLDPLKGDPYVWATLRGKTLTVHAMVITEDHGYEMQTYHRTLSADGMELEFTRVRDDERLKDVRGTLVRKKS